MREVDPPRIAAVQRCQRPAQPVGIGWYEDQMHMIGHEHVRPDLDASRTAMRTEQLAIEGIIAVFEEGLSAAVAALRDMMGKAGKYGPCQARHRAKARKPTPR